MSLLPSLVNLSNVGTAFLLPDMQLEKRLNDVLEEEPLDSTGSIDVDRSQTASFIIKTAESAKATRANNAIVANALIEFVEDVKRGGQIERKEEACASALISFLVLTPSEKMYYTSEYEYVEINGYHFDDGVEKHVLGQDHLIQQCIAGFRQQHPLRRTLCTGGGIHGHDASFHADFVAPMDAWWHPNVDIPITTPVSVTVTRDCRVYTCGDRPRPFPSPGQFLHADDSILWTHTSRFWS